MTSDIYLVERRIAVGPRMNHRVYRLEELSDLQAAAMRTRVRYPVGPLPITAMVLWPVTESDDVLNQEFA